MPGEAWQRLAATGTAQPSTLTVGLLYGDRAEEVMLRWGVMSLVAWLLYGWLFWRHHLEAAMAAHAGTHVGLWAWRSLAA